MEPRLFDGLKVLDCASFIAAPATATVLSDFGADVIKLEPPEAGDPYRNLSTLPGYPVSNHNYAWMLDARNKKSLAVDLAKPEGQAILRRLVTQSDIFITNYPFPVRRRLEIAYENLAPLNERLIYASFTGYGETGDEVNKPGFDSNAWWGRSGLMDMVRPDVTGAPARSVPGMGDHASAMSLLSGILMALYRRDRTGKGGKVSSSLVANGVWSNACFAQASLCGADVKIRPSRDQAVNALANHYQCKDGRWLILSLLNEERQWPVLAKCLGVADLVADPRFAEKKSRHINAQALIGLFDKAFASRTLSEWRRILDEAGLIFGVVATVNEIPNDKQMLDAGVLVPFADDTMLTVNSPVWLEGEDKVRPRHPPGLGQHTDEVLRAAGYDKVEIERLRASNVVA
jgi:crotonobetainyl-CoA:carnitine CoA-transferase CaiB-like acyl-CoA transferase